MELKDRDIGLNFDEWGIEYREREIFNDFLTAVDRYKIMLKFYAHYHEIIKNIYKLSSEERIKDICKEILEFNPLI